MRLEALQLPKRFLAPVMVTAAGVRPMRAAKWAVRAGRTSRALGTACLLLAGLTASINGALYLLEAAPPPDAWNGMSVLLFLLAAAVCFTWKRGGE